MMLWRPVGLAEMRLILESDMRAYPPRLPQQPIFYPVLNEGYAARISRNWNANEEPFAGYVTRCEVSGAFAINYAVQIVGSRDDAELWIPAEQLGRFNAAVLGRIDVVRAHFGPAFRGQRPASGPLAGLDATDQIQVLSAAHRRGTLPAVLGSAGSASTVFLNYPFWRAFATRSQDAADPCRGPLAGALCLWWQEHGNGVPLVENTEIVLQAEG